MKHLLTANRKVLLRMNGRSKEILLINQLLIIIVPKQNRVRTRKEAI